MLQRHLLRRLRFRVWGNRFLHKSGYVIQCLKLRGTLCLVFDEWREPGRPVFYVHDHDSREVVARPELHRGETAAPVPNLQRGLARECDADDLVGLGDHGAHVSASFGPRSLRHARIAPIFTGTFSGTPMRRLTVLGLLLTAGWALAIVIVLFFRADDVPTMSLNAWGDFLAGVSAPLALLWLVVGYFQHGEELRLNTRALEAQQEELRRQVEETATLAENADRQAQATERLVQLNKAEQERLVRRDVMEAQLDLVGRGGSSSGDTITQKFLNVGGTVQDLQVHYEGRHDLSLSPTGRMESKSQGTVTVRRSKQAPIQFPIRFSLTYTDRFGSDRRRDYEMAWGEGLRDVTDLSSEWGRQS